ncbi:MAG: hypothetical protein M3362_20465, partial [Acidobacteriota bacterium]|nr:hypothetical protein [Acidobacteriota bacterium]
MPTQTSIKRAKNSLLLLILLTTLTVPALGGEPVIWQTSSRTELLRGDVRGVSITDTGALLLAPQFSQVFNTD